jgi:hypothetical protein
MRCLPSFSSQPDPLDFIERQALFATIIKLGGTGAFVGGHGLGVLEGPAIFQIRRNPCRPKSMATDWGLDTCGFGPSADHAPGIGLPMGCSASTSAFQPLAVQNSQALRCSPIPAAAI